jgi:hypothetical protein
VASLLTDWDWAEAADAHRLIATVPAKADAWAIFPISIELSSVTGAETNRSDQMDREKIPPQCGTFSRHS